MCAVGISTETPTLGTCAVPCGSGRAREAATALQGTGLAGVRGHARSHKVASWARLRLANGSGGWRSCSRLAQGLLNARYLRGSLWERASPRSSHRVAGHRPCRCSRACPTKVASWARLHLANGSGGWRSCSRRAQRSVLARSPVGAGEPAKQPPRCRAPALPVFAGMPHKGRVLGQIALGERQRRVAQLLKACSTLGTCAVQSPVGAGEPAK